MKEEMEKYRCLECGKEFPGILRLTYTFRIPGKPDLRVVHKCPYCRGRIEKVKETKGG